MEAQDFAEKDFEKSAAALQEASDSDDVKSELDDDDRTMNSLFKARNTWVKEKIAAARSRLTINDDSAVSNARRLLIKDFLKVIISRPRCDNCKAMSPKFRKDGVAKIFEEPLPAKCKASNDQRGRAKLDVMQMSKKSFEKGLSGPQTRDNDMEEDGSDSSEEAGDLYNEEAREKPRSKAARAKTRYVTSQEVYRHLQKLFRTEHSILRLLYRGKKSLSPDVFFLNAVLVPPVKFRPAAKLGDTLHENIQNELLSKILTSSNRIREISAAIANKNDPLSASAQHQQFDQLINTSVALQHSVNSLIDSTKNPDPVGQNREPPPGIKQILEKKEGLFRKHMMGKRVNHAARSVISPDPNIETNEIGVPPLFARKLTYPEPVTAHNYALMRQAVINGATNYPGATHVQHEDGTLTSLMAMATEERTALANQLLTPLTSGGTGFEKARIRSTNKKVLRHLRNGDMLLLNRQPTLHKPSIMAHKARILAGEKTIRMHYANCNTYNADFDGDEMNMHFPQNENAKAEAALIANTDNQYLVPTSGDPLRGLIQDHVVIAVWMTNRETFFTKEEYQQLLYGTIRPEDEKNLDKDPRILTLPPTIWKPRKLWSGKQLVSTLLTNLKPESMHGLNLESKCKVAGKYWSPDSEEGKVIFKDGVLMTGILDKSQFGASAYGMVHSIYDLYGAEYAGRLLSMLGRLFTKYAQMRAFTCRMDDLRLHDEGNVWRRTLLDEGRLAGTEASSQYVGLTTVDPADAQLRDRLEEVLRDDEKLQGLDAAMKGKMNKLTSSIIDKCIPDGLLKKFPHNHMQTMTVSGAKGSNVNVSQISCLLGQQELEGRRVPIMVSGKTLPSFKAFDSSAKAGGFIAGRFLTGIKPQEYYFHCMAGREGLIDTAVKTSRSGYLQRCLIKHLEGIRVNYDATVRDADGSVIQMNYGEDSLDVIKSKHLTQFSFAAANFKSIKTRLDPDTLSRNPAIDISSAGKKLMSKTIKKPMKYDPALLTNDPARQVGIVSESYYNQLEDYIDKNPDGLLHPKEVVKKHKDRLSAEVFRTLMHMKYQVALAEPGEAVGILASQSVGEPSTQMTLNTFHFAGFGAKNVTLGIPRLREIIMTASSSIKTPTMSMKILPGVKEEDALNFAKRRCRVLLSQLIESAKVTEINSSSNAGSAKQYKIQLNLFTEQEYQDEYNVDRLQLQHILTGSFQRELAQVITKEIKKVTGKVSKADKAVPEIGTSVRRLRKTQEFDENVAHETGVNDDDGEDGDATDAKLKDRSKMKASYEKPDEEEEAIRKEANNSDSDNDDSIEVDLHSDDEGQGSVKDGAGHEEEESAISSRNLSQRTLRIAKGGNAHVIDFDFNKAGDRCTMTIQYPVDTPKLLMVNLVEEASKNTIVQELPGIIRCFSAPSEGLDESRYLATEGINFKAFWLEEGIISHNDLYSNDIAAIGATYGVEAMRQAIIKEVSGVFAVYGIGVDTRHLSLIADYMTFEGGYKPFNRMGIESNSSPFLKMTYETTCTFLTQAALHGDYDTVDNPSSKIVMGRLAAVGTGTFDVMQETA